MDPEQEKALGVRSEAAEDEVAGFTSVPVAQQQPPPDEQPVAGLRSAQDEEVVQLELPMGVRPGERMPRNRIAQRKRDVCERSLKTRGEEIW